MHFCEFDTIGEGQEQRKNLRAADDGDFIHVARNATTFEPDNASLKRRMRARFDKLKRFL